VALNHVVEAHRPALRDTLERLPRGSAFARIREGERTVALALGSLADGHVYLGEVVTDTERRRSGLARQLLEATLHWARERGAHRAFLAVEADNAPARALYEGLGFREAYRYWYREAAHAASPD
jgi:ribosomal protein S18 acetylase RimI-like enzyme